MEHRFLTRSEASITAAGHISAAITRRLETHARTAIAVSGGTTPAACYRALSKAGVEWPRVDVVLSDERWVPADHADSNEWLVRNTLLTNKAVKARLIATYDGLATVETRCMEFEAALRELAQPFACSLLGMGIDGHFASLFPDAGNLAEGLREQGERLCLPIETAASPYLRVSLTLAALARSDEIILLFFGEDKRKVLDTALNSDSRLPVCRLLTQNCAPVHVYWAP